MTPDPWQPLFERAQSVRLNSYSPYSRFAIGACIESESGQRWTGTNVENLSLGLTLCAERSAIAAMVSAGEKQWVRIAVASAPGVTPCGACRQVLSEFAGVGATVRCYTTSGEFHEFSFEALFPNRFETELPRTSDVLPGVQGDRR
jgi:cytidine deaminase